MKSPKGTANGELDGTIVSSAAPASPEEGTDPECVMFHNFLELEAYNHPHLT